MRWIVIPLAVLAYLGRIAYVSAESRMNYLETVSISNTESVTFIPVGFLNRGISVRAFALAVPDRVTSQFFADSILNRHCREYFDRGFRYIVIGKDLDPIVCPQLERSADHFMRWDDDWLASACSQATLFGYDESSTGRIRQQLSRLTSFDLDDQQTHSAQQQFSLFGVSCLLQTVFQFLELYSNRRDVLGRHGTSTTEAKNSLRRISNRSGVARAVRDFADASLNAFTVSTVWTGWAGGLSMSDLSSSGAISAMLRGRATEVPIGPNWEQSRYAIGGQPSGQEFAFFSAVSASDFSCCRTKAGADTARREAGQNGGEMERTILRRFIGDCILHAILRRMRFFDYPPDTVEALPCIPERWLITC